MVFEHHLRSLPNVVEEASEAGDLESTPELLTYAYECNAAAIVTVRKRPQSDQEAQERRVAEIHGGDIEGYIGVAAQLRLQ